MPESRAKPKKRFDAGGAVAGRAERRCAPWTAWARSLIDKYEPVKQLHNSLEMTLVQPFAAIRLIPERWLLATRELKPQINLFLNPNLQLSRWHLPGVVNSFGDVRHENHIRTASLALAGASPHTSHLPGNVDRNAGEPDPATRLWPSIANHHVNPAVFESNDRESVATRRRAIDEASRVRLGKRILENAETFARRVETHTRRVEERIEGLAALTLRRINATVERQTASTRPPVDEPSAQGRMSAYEEAAASIPTEFGGRNIDVDQLTDRVIRELDRRVVAIRERMGRR